MSRKTVPEEMLVNGGYILGIINSVEEETVRPFREKHGLTDIKADQWYSAQQFINFTQDIAENGQLFDLVAMGVNSVKLIEFPPGVDSIEKLLPMMTYMHNMAWRNGDPGGLEVKMIGDKHLQMMFENLPLPIDLVYGLCYGMVKRFTPANSKIIVTQQEEGEKYIFDMKW